MHGIQSVGKTAVPKEVRGQIVNSLLIFRFFHLWWSDARIFPSKEERRRVGALANNNLYGVTHIEALIAQIYSNIIF